MRDYYLEIDDIEENREQKRKESERDEREPAEKPEYKPFAGNGRRNIYIADGKKPRSSKPLNRRREGETKPMKRK